MLSKRCMILSLLCLLIVIPSISATETYLGVIKLNDCILLRQTSTTATFVNISVVYPNSSTGLTETTMTKNGYSFTYNFCNTDLVGRYIADGHGDLDGTDQPFTYTFDVSISGTNLTIGQGILYILYILGAGFVFIVCLYFSIVIPFSNSRDESGNVIGINDMKYVKIFLICMDYVIFMTLMGMLRSITANYLPILGVSGMFEWIFWIMLSFLYPLIIIGIIWTIIIYVTERKLLKQLERGFDIK